jgi:MFS family permease
MPPTSAPASARTRDAAIGETIHTDIPSRLDTLRWSRWHVRVVVGLGITWILDGLESSLVANLGPTLTDRRTLGLSAAEVGLANTTYLLGEVLGALLFGYLTDRWGRRRLFMITLALYLSATALSGAAPSYGVFLLFRFLAGAGIGGECSAMNSAVDELIPARIRGQIDLAINGSYWMGVALGAGLTLLLLDTGVFPITVGWRLAFGLGAVLGLGVLVLRRTLPESPRWLLMHGYVRSAESAMDRIERQANGHVSRAQRRVKVPIRVVGAAGVRDLGRVLFVRNRRRALLGLSLMVSQAFFYNAIFFTYGLILERFHGVPAGRVGLYIVPFAIGNFCGPVLLGHLFDRVGRRTMIPLTYALSGVLLAVTGFSFLQGYLTALSQTMAWCGVFFFASAAASSAYLTVSELFPVQLRGMAIAIFYSIATTAGAIAPAVFGRLIDANSPRGLFFGYLFAAALMICAAVAARVLGVSSEGRSLEELNAPES